MSLWNQLKGSPSAHGSPYRAKHLEACGYLLVYPSFVTEHSQVGVAGRRWSQVNSESSLTSEGLHYFLIFLILV